jgi:hypothetical protein
MDAASSVAAPSSLVGASSDTPAPKVFQTPPPDEADTEEERERRRRALALEQQRLILEQVEAARAAAKASKKAVPGQPSSSHQPVVRVRGESRNRRIRGLRYASYLTIQCTSSWLFQSVIMRRSSNHNQHKDREMVATDAKSAPHPAQPKVTRKGPRTKGKLYSRLADGSLVEEGSGDTLSGSPVDGNGVDRNANVDERVAASAAERAATKASNGQADPSKGKPSAKKNWGSKNRRPKKHQVAALVDR